MAGLDKRKTADRLREFGLPTAAGVVAAGAGLVLTRKRRPRDVVPDVKGVGDLVDDLRGKLDSVIGKGGSGRATEEPGRNTDQFSSDEFAKRRRARAQRRNERRGRTGR